MTILTNRLLFTTLALATSSLMGCAESKKENQSIETVRPVKMATIESMAANIERSFPAQVTANESTDLAFRVSGQITKYHVIEGDNVNKGTLIAELDPTDFNIVLDNAKAKYELSVSQHERNSTLVPKGLATKAEFDTSRAEMLMAKARLDRAKQNLKYTQIYAPYDGVVAKKHGENHDHIAATQPIIEFQNDNLSDVQFDLPEKLLNQFDPEKFKAVTTQVVLDSYPNRPLIAQFKEMRKSATAGALSFRVTMSVNVPQDMRAFPGMSASVNTVIADETLANNNTVIAPMSALFSPENIKINEDRKFVWVVDSSNKTHLREVNIVRFLSDGAVINSGLVAGDKVVTAGTYLISENQQVKELKRERGI
ncbi:efflux RND transporter periplasmic adaptor subunit [Shewanella sp. 10N.286.45.A1]|uniref:efflux RND transporter periplasmic adaptor subunit n=1 Tax=Shewanella sp. 10N.286.45.A1 TaxID=3229694 RepID=UPI00354E5050